MSISTIIRLIVFPYARPVLLRIAYTMIGLCFTFNCCGDRQAGGCGEAVYVKAVMLTLYLICAANLQPVIQLQ